MHPYGKQRFSNDTANRDDVCRNGEKASVQVVLHLQWNHFDLRAPLSRKDK
jgi:hypothetical protein